MYEEKMEGLDQTTTSTEVQLQMDHQSCDNTLNCLCHGKTDWLDSQDCQTKKTSMQCPTNGGVDGLDHQIHKPQMSGTNIGGANFN